MYTNIVLFFLQNFKYFLPAQIFLADKGFAPLKGHVRKESKFFLDSSPKKRRKETKLIDRRVCKYSTSKIKPVLS